MFIPPLAQHLTLIDNVQRRMHAAEMFDRRLEAELRRWSIPGDPWSTSSMARNHVALCGRGEFPFLALRRARDADGHDLGGILEVWPPYRTVDSVQSPTLFRCEVCWQITGRRRPA